MASIKVLIADDESHVTYMLAMKFKRPDVEVLTANDGEEAYELACTHRPNLIVTDFQMPVLTGYEMAVKLRENFETTNIPLIMLTGRGHRLSPTDLAKTNIQHLVPKPFSARDLLERAAEFISVYQDNAADVRCGRTGTTAA